MAAPAVAVGAGRASLWALATTTKEVTMIDTASSRRNFLMGAGAVAGISAVAGTVAVKQAQAD